MGRRWPYRLYFLLMCLFYMLMVFVFHGQLQMERLHNKQMRGIVRHVHAALLKFNESSDNVAGLKRELYKHQIQNESAHSRPHRPLSADCLISPRTTEYEFQTVIPDVLYIYSAYWDARTTQTFIRVMAILAKNKKGRIELTCLVRGQNVSAVVYEMCENHNKMLGGYIFSFPIEKDFKPCQVTLEVRESGSSLMRTVMVSVTAVSPNTAQYKYGVCIPPLFGDVDKGRLVEFIELNQLLGAQHFVFYDYHISKNESRKILDYYQSVGLVTVIPWNLPLQVKDSSIWYHGQLVAHNDCLYRAMSLYQVMVLQDIDEYIVPHTEDTTWSAALSHLFQVGVVGLSFHSAFFDPGDSKSGDFITMSQFTRTSMYSRVRTKVMVLPPQIFEVGIHHVSKPLLEDSIIKTVDTNVANLHHYRKCVKNFGMKCDKMVEDKTMLKYVKSLSDRFRYIMNFTIL